MLSKDLRLQIAWGEAGAPFKEMEAGRVAVHFTQSCDKQLRTGASSPGFENLISHRACLTFIDGTWLHTVPEAEGWQSGTVRRDFELVFVGTTAELADAVSKLLRGHDVTVQCRRRRKTAETHWVRYSLKAPNNKALARDPSAPPGGKRPLSAWIAELRDPSSFVREQAALGALADALKSPDLLVRHRAAEALGGRGAQAEGALRAVLQDPEPEVRQAALEAVKRIGANERN